MGATLRGLAVDISPHEVQELAGRVVVAENQVAQRFVQKAVVDSVPAAFELSPPRKTNLSLAADLSASQMTLVVSNKLSIPLNG